MTTLVDSNVLLDVIGEDPNWADWSAAQIAAAAADGPIAINPIIYAEISLGFDTVEALDEATTDLTRLPLPFAAGFLAARCFVRYRRAGGVRRSPLPDFYIGAHAALDGHALLTRDAARYRTYLPRLELISP